MSPKIVALLVNMIHYGGYRHPGSVSSAFCGGVFYLTAGSFAIAATLKRRKSV